MVEFCSLLVEFCSLLVEFCSLLVEFYYNIEQVCRSSKAFLIIIFCTTIFLDVELVKTRARKRKGRGFDAASSQREVIDNYEAISPTKTENLDAIAQRC